MNSTMIIGCALCCCIVTIVIIAIIYYVSTSNTVVLPKIDTEEDRLNLFFNFRDVIFPPIVGNVVTNNIAKYMFIHKTSSLQETNDIDKVMRGLIKANITSTSMVAKTDLDHFTLQQLAYVYNLPTELTTSTTGIAYACKYTKSGSPYALFIILGLSDGKQYMTFQIPSITYVN